MRDYWYYGLRLRTGLRLPGLPAWPDLKHETGAPLFVLHQGTVPGHLPGLPVRSFGAICDAQGQILIHFPKLFRLLITNEHEAVIDIAPEAPDTEIESYLLSYIAGAILHRRRDVPLHASCVMAEGRAIIIAGHSGRGKSTLATALISAGHTLLSDDITVIRFGPTGNPLAVPGSPHLRLTDETARAAAIDAGRLGASRAGDDKRIWRRDAVHFDPVPVASVIRLEVAPLGEGPSIDRLNGPSAVLPLPDLIYRFALGKRLGAAAGLAHGALRLAARTPIFRLSRSQDFAALGATIDLVVAAGARPAVPKQAAAISPGTPGVSISTHAGTPR